VVVPVTLALVLDQPEPTGRPQALNRLARVAAVGCQVSLKHIGPTGFLTDERDHGSD